jgi:hypothetical protein
LSKARVITCPGAPDVVADAIVAFLATVEERNSPG